MGRPRAAEVRQRWMPAAITAFGLHPFHNFFEWMLCARRAQIPGKSSPLRLKIFLTGWNEHWRDFQWSENRRGAL